MGLLGFMDHLIQMAVENYDVSDLINQSIIVFLAMVILARFPVRFKFHRKSAFDY